MIEYPDTPAPYFYLSYAHSDPLAGNPRANPDQLVGEFFGDLVEAVRRHASRREGLVPGFYDQELPVGSDWKQFRRKALGAAQVFVPLYSVGYLTTSWPGRELACFRQRVEDAGLPDAEQRFVPVLWAPLSGVEDPPVLRAALAAGATPDYTENGLRALLKIRSYRDSYDAEVNRFAEQIVELAEIEPIQPAQVPDIDEFPPDGPLAEFAIELAVPAGSVQWRPFPGQELQLAEYAEQVVKTFNFDPRISEVAETARAADRQPGIVVIDPEFIATEKGRSTLKSIAGKLPRWVLPLVVLGQPDNARTRRLAAEVNNILTKANALPTESARRAARGVDSLDQFVSMIPVLVAEAERQYLRYGYVAGRVPSQPAAERLSLRRTRRPAGTGEPPDRLGGTRDG